MSTPSEKERKARKKVYLLAYSLWHFYPVSSLLVSCEIGFGLVLARLLYAAVAAAADATADAVAVVVVVVPISHTRFGLWFADRYMRGY